MTEVTANTPASRPILVADDESHILNVVALKLRRAGYNVVTASDGQMLVKLARQIGPALIVTDFHMPHLSGLEACLELAKDPQWKVPALLLTARDRELSEEDRQASHIVAVINKPFSPRALLAAVEQHFPGSRAAA